MATMHFDEYPLSRDLVNVPVGEIEGEKFKDWEDSADYTVQTTVVIQIDTYDITASEYNIAPNITAISSQQYLINIYRIWHRNGVSYNEFQAYYALREQNLNNYAENLASRLNTARHNEGKHGDWYINYSLNERHVRIHRPSGTERGED